MRDNNFLKLIRDKYLDYRIRKSKGREIYYIKINGKVSGFFALLRMAVDSCCYADDNGFLPYIKYDGEILYAENRFFLGTDNPFEYYFEQPTALSSFSDLKGINVIRIQSIHTEGIELRYNLKPLSYLAEDIYIERMSEIYGKYIQLNARTDKIINRGIKELLKGKRTLGVHIRGTDFYKEFNNHPVPVTVDEYVKAIERIISQHHYEQVFVATDDIRCLKELKRKMQIPLVFYKNVRRSESHKSVAFEHSERKHDHYLLGLEILRDAYTLAVCDSFVGCLSQVDIFVRIIKMSMGQEFESLNIIDKGILRNNRECWEPRD